MKSFHPWKWSRAAGLSGATLILFLCALAAAAASDLTWIDGSAQAQAQAQTVPADAVPIKYDPAANAVLQVPPTKVQVTFGQPVKADLSTIVVVNAANQEVDDQDSRVGSGGYVVTVTLPLLPAGTYVVLWRSHSARDGSIAGGSYVFHIASADGTVPALKGPLPHDSLSSGSAATQGSNTRGVSLLTAVARWLGLLGLTLFLGMVFWWAVIQPRQHLSQTLAAELDRRMRQSSAPALLMVLAAMLLEAAVQALQGGLPATATVVPSWLGATVWNRPSGHAILAGVVLSLVGILVARRRKLGRPEGAHEPRNQRLLLLAYAAVLALAFEFSGSGAPVTAWWGPLVDYLHLLANGVWLGGLLYLAIVLTPALQTRSSRERQGYLAASIVQFNIPALLAVALVIVTGPLDATARMNGPEQLWTTAFGVVLVIKSVLFLGMAAIAYYYAFVLRPRLAQLTRTTGVTQSVGQETVGSKLGEIPVIGRFARDLGSDVFPTASPSAVSSLYRGQPVALLPPTGGEFNERAAELWELNQELRIGGGADTAGSAARQSEILSQRMLKWLRFAAILGAGVLFCAALLIPLAGTLAASTSSANRFATAAGAQTFTHTVDGLVVTMSVSPGTFGSNVITVLVQNPNGTPLTDGQVSIQTDMVEMDMGTDIIKLTPATTAGTFSGQGQIPMEGHWRLQVGIRTPQDPDRLLSTTFTIYAGYPPGF